MKVLIPVQDAIFGDAIIAMLTSHQWSSDTEFRLLTVVEPPSYGEMMGEMYCCEYSHGLIAQRQALAKRLLADYAARLKQAVAGVNIEERTVIGSPKEMILDEAQQWAADLIVMGSHARRGLSRFLLGSVSSAVLSESPCSVVIVKIPAQSTSGDQRAAAPAVAAGTSKK